MGQTPNFDLRDGDFKNDCINGRFDIWQRGTSRLLSPPNTLYLADRFGCGMDTGDGVITMLRISDPPNISAKLTFAKRYKMTTANSSLAASDYAVVQYNLEGYDFVKYINKNMYVYFYVRSSVSGTYGLVARNNAGDRIYATPYTISVADTWEWKECVIPFSTVPAGGGFNFTNGTGTYLWWALGAVGSSRVAPSYSQWLTSASSTTGISGSPAFTTVLNAQWDIAGVVISPHKLNSNDYSEILLGTSYDRDLLRCLRYYESPIEIQHGSSGGHDFTTSMTMLFKVRKRTVPTVIVISQFDSNSFGATEDYVAVSRPFPRNVIQATVAVEAEL